MKRVIHQSAVVGVAGLLGALGLTPAALGAGSPSAGKAGSVVVKKKSIEYGGKTSQGLPVEFKISGKKVSGQLEWMSSCGGSSSLTDTTPFHAKYKNHKFKAHGTNSQIISGYEFHFTYSIAGKVTGNKSSGTFSATGTTTGYTCPSGSLTWSAKS